MPRPAIGIKFVVDLNQSYHIQVVDMSVVLDEAYSSISDELIETREVVREALKSRHPELEQIDSYTLSVPGKMLRPALVLLSGYCATGSRENSDLLVKLAAIFELLHTASLVHDDLLDEESVRRNLPALHTIFGSHIAVLAGDVLFTRAFALLSEYFDRETARPIIEVATGMCHGEILAAAESAQVLPATYREIIGLKTAMMMRTACASGAAVAGATGAVRDAFSEFGARFGVAYQLLDDLVDDDQPLESAAIAAMLEREMVALETARGRLPRNIFGEGLARMTEYFAGRARVALEERNLMQHGVQHGG